VQDLTVEQYAQAILERKVNSIRLGELMGQGVMHAVQLEVTQGVEPWPGHHLVVSPGQWL
jgi:hypothetical protein